MASPAGQVLHRASEIKLDLARGIHITLDDIPADEYTALCVLEAEEQRLIQEQEQPNG